jgi:hypothetical protein
MLYYTYRTLCLITDQYYLGRHSTQKSPEQDRYLGSGVWIRQALKIYGRQNFKREILAFYSSREELIKAEESLVNPAVLEDPLCMNKVVGGCGNDLSLEVARCVEQDPNWLTERGKRGGAQSWKVRRRRIAEDPAYALRALQNLKRGQQLYLERLKQNPELLEQALTRWRDIGKKNLCSPFTREDGLKAGRERQRRMLEDPEFRDRMIGVFKNNAAIRGQRMKEDPEFKLQVEKQLADARFKRQQKLETDPEFRKRLASAKGSRWISNPELKVSNLVKDPTVFLHQGWVLGRHYK